MSVLCVILGHAAILFVLLRFRLELVFWIYIAILFVVLFFSDFIILYFLRAIKVPNRKSKAIKKILSNLSFKLGIEEPKIYFYESENDKKIHIQSFNRSCLLVERSLDEFDRSEIKNLISKNLQLFYTFRFKVVSFFVLVFIFLEKLSLLLSLGNRNVFSYVFSFFFWMITPYISIYFFFFKSRERRPDFLMQNNILLVSNNYRQYLRQLTEEMC